MAKERTTHALPAGFLLHSKERVYEIVKVLGSGSYGITYLATSKVAVGNISATMRFAIKEHFMSASCYRGDDGAMVLTVPTAKTDVVDSRADFLTEANRLKKLCLKSRNIVSVNETFEANGTAYYVMEYLSKSAYNLDYWYAPAHYEIGEYFLNKGDRESAELFFKNALDSFNPENKQRYSNTGIENLDRDDITDQLFNIAVSYMRGEGEVELYSDFTDRMTPEALSRFEYLTPYDDDALLLLMEYYAWNGDEAKTLEYARQAYDRNLPASGFRLGRIYQEGLGVPKDLDKALSFYEFGTISGYGQECRYFLSGLYYNSSKPDRAFRHAYDYAHHSKVAQGSSTADVLHILASCYRFGRGVKQNIALANIWDALGIWYCDYEERAETMAEFLGIDLKSNTQLLEYIVKLLYENIDPRLAKSNSSVSLLCGMHYAFVEKNWREMQKQLVNAYYMEGALPEVQIMAAYLLASSAPGEDGKRAIKDFVERYGMNPSEIEDDVLDESFYKVFVEMIKEIEKGS